MQRFSFFVMCSVFATCANSAYLPVVDVSNGTVSARAAFGEEIINNSQQKNENVAKVSAPNNKKVVTRAAKKSLAATTSNDVLKPNRPRSDLWAKNTETPLRMPRMDEIAVIDSDDILPEESLDSKTTQIAQNNSEQRVSRDEALNELRELRQEIARLSELQKQSVARARPLPVRTPISGEEKNVQPLAEPARHGIRRESVPAETEKQIVRQNIMKNTAEPKISLVDDMSKMSPNELKKAFKKTYLSENKHLSTYEADDKYDVVSDMRSGSEGFSAARDLSEMDSGVRPLEIKISFMNNDAGLSRDNYNLLSETASIVVNNPKRAIQIAIPESVAQSKDTRKLAARRLAIVEQVLRDTGVSDKRIIPVLSQRDDDVFVLRIISNDVFESLTQQKRNMFGDSVSQKTYKSMSW